MLINARRHLSTYQIFNFFAACCYSPYLSGYLRRLRAWSPQHTPGHRINTHYRSIHRILGFRCWFFWQSLAIRAGRDAGWTAMHSQRHFPPRAYTWLATTRGVAPVKLRFQKLRAAVYVFAAAFNGVGMT